MVRDLLILFFGFLLGVLIVSSKAEDWDTTDKVLGSTALTLTIIDWAQTRTIAKNPDQWHEDNPLLSEDPSIAEVNRHFLGAIVIGGLIAHFLPSTARKFFLGTVVAIELKTTHDNHSIGIKTSF